MKFTAEKLAQITNSEIKKITGNTCNYRISTDTRTINENCFYLPLKGERFNGEDFIEDALNKGAKGYFTTNPNLVFENSENIFVVKDTKEAYLKIASAYKTEIAPKTVMITGSSGKTTVRNMIASVLSEKYKVHKTQKNFNNETGLCQTLLSMPEDTQMLVVEGGMRGFGEIELLTKFLNPDIGVITNVGTAHVGRLGSRENIAKAKCEITSGLSEILICPNDDLIKKNNNFKNTLYVDFSDIKTKKSTLEGSLFEYKGFEYFLPAEGEHNIQNACLAIETALYSGLTPGEISEGLKKFVPEDNRGQNVIAGNFRIVSDCYNANPDSMKASIKTFSQGYPAPKVFILGDMGELGEKEIFYHEQVGEYLKNFDFRELLTVGTLSEHILKNDKRHKHFSKNEDVVKYLKKEFQKPVNVLLKASRSMKFEEIAEGLQK